MLTGISEMKMVTDNTKCWQRCGAQQTYRMGWKRGAAPLEGGLAAASKVKYTLNMWPTILLLGIYTGSLKTAVHSRIGTWMFVSSLVCSSPQLEATQTSFRVAKDQLTGMYPWLLSNTRNELLRHTAAWMNLRPHDEWKTPVSKDQTGVMEDKSVSARGCGSGRVWEEIARRRFWGRWWNHSVSRSEWWLDKPIARLKCTEVYTKESQCQPMII